MRAGDFSVPAGQAEMAISLYWPGSKIDLVIHDPKGNTYSQGSPGVSIIPYANLLCALIPNPVSGNWWLEVIGTVVTGTSEPFYIVVSSQAGTPPPPPPRPSKTESPKFPVALALLFILLGGGGIALYVYATVIKRQRGWVSGDLPGSQLEPIASLQFFAGPFAGHVFPIRSNTVTIGRSSINQVRIPDLTVSRLHAVIRCAAGRWYLYDQNSKAGTWVNGSMVRAIDLNNGDRIQIGSSVLLFRSSLHRL